MDIDLWPLHTLKHVRTHTLTHTNYLSTDKLQYEKKNLSRANHSVLHCARRHTLPPVAAQIHRPAGTKRAEQPPESKLAQQSIPQEVNPREVTRPKLGAMVHTCDPGTLEAEAGGSL